MTNEDDTIAASARQSAVGDFLEAIEVAKLKFQAAITCLNPHQAFDFMDLRDRQTGELFGVVWYPKDLPTYMRPREIDPTSICRRWH